MKVISVIEDQEVIKKILKHLGLWQVKPRPPPRNAKSQQISGLLPFAFPADHTSP
jgi:hypothetical protein